MGVTNMILTFALIVLSNAISLENEPQFVETSSNSKSVPIKRQVSYEYFRKLGEQKSLELKIRINPSCGGRNEKTNYKSPVIILYAKSYSNRDRRQPWKLAIYPHLEKGRIELRGNDTIIIKPASFEDAGVYQVICPQQVSLSKTPQTYSAYFEVAPQLLLVDSVSSTIKPVSSVENIISQLHKAYSAEHRYVNIDPEMLKDELMKNFATLKLNLNAKPSKKAVIEFKQLETHRLLRFHVGNGFWIDSRSKQPQKGAFSTDMNLMNNLVDRPQRLRPTESEFWVKNLPNGTTYSYDISLNRIVERKPNQCDIFVKTQISTNHRKNLTEIAYLKFRYRPQNVTVQLNNFANGTCSIVCSASSLCPSELISAFVELEVKTNTTRVIDKFPLDVATLSHKFAKPVCARLNNQIKIEQTLTVKCVLVNKIGDGTMPPVPSSLLTTNGEYKGFDDSLPWWVILIIILAIFIVIVITICIIFAFIKDKKRNSDKETPSRGYFRRTNPTPGISNKAFEPSVHDKVCKEEIVTLKADGSAPTLKTDSISTRSGIINNNPIYSIAASEFSLRRLGDHQREKAIDTVESGDKEESIQPDDRNSDVSSKSNSHLRLSVSSFKKPPAPVNDESTEEVAV